MSANRQHFVSRHVIPLYAVLIKANLVFNIIWLLFGIVATFIVQWLVRNYDVDLSVFTR